ncbi:MAG: Sec-independent protein translocase protein TatB [Gammaproteobacteria bacterium]
MFEVGFTELLVIFVLALVVLGPEKLPRVAAQVGRWVGRARAMARQFKEQLEEEVNVAEANKTRPATPPPSSSLDVPPESSVSPDHSTTAESPATPADSAARTEGHDAGPSPEPEAEVYQPPAYATAPSDAAHGPSSEPVASAVESPPSETASNDTAAPLPEPALRPGDVITSTHERGI